MELTVSIRREGKYGSALVCIHKTETFAVGSLGEGETWKVGKVSRTPGLEVRVYVN